MEDSFHIRLFFTKIVQFAQKRRGVFVSFYKYYGKPNYTIDNGSEMRYNMDTEILYRIFLKMSTGFLRKLRKEDKK